MGEGGGSTGGDRGGGNTGWEGLRLVKEDVLDEEHGSQNKGDQLEVLIGKWKINSV